MLYQLEVRRRKRKRARDEHIQPIPFVQFAIVMDGYGEGKRSLVLRGLF
jgi:hypothetical protein